MADRTTSVEIAFDGGPRFPIEWSGAWSMKQTRGFSPYMFTIQLSDTSNIPESTQFQDGAKCSFFFTGPDPSTGEPTEAEWKNWYLVRTESPPHRPGSRILTFADERWKLQHELITASYNVQWPDGSYRDDTVPGGGGATGSIWSALDAAVDVLKKFGYEANTDGVGDTVGAGKKSIPLPNNLGNSSGGGWVEADLEEILAPMLYTIDCDLLWGVDGQPRIVDRSGDPEGNIATLHTLPRIVDTSEPTQNNWERPRKLRVAFEIKIEAAIEGGVTLDEQATSSSGSEPAFEEPVNVMPSLDRADVDPQEWWDAQLNEQDDTRFVIIDDEIVRLGYASTDVEADLLIRRNYFLPLIVPLLVAGSQNQRIVESGDPGTNALLAKKKIWVDAQLRKCWRRLYRVEYPTRSTPVVKKARYLSGIALGRLTPGGTTRERGSVFCDWVDKTSSVYAFTNNPFDNVYSENHEYDPEQPAPFTAQWVADRGSELIFELVPPQASRIGQAEVLPGTLNEPFSYGDYFDAVAGQYIRTTEGKATFNSDFRFRVIAAGRLIADAKMQNKSSPVGEVEGRVLVVEKELFSEGSIESFDLKESNTTANFGFSSQQLATESIISDQWPQILLNSSEIQRRVNALGVYMKRRYELGEAGGFLMPGVNAVRDGINAGGDIAEMSIVVGNPDPWSITTQYVVLPGMARRVLLSEDREGYPVASIAESQD